MKVNLKIWIPNWLDKICAWPVMAYRRRRYGYPFRRIGLTEGKFAIVDPQDFYWLNEFEWCAERFRGSFYAVRFNNTSDKSPRILSMHREIMKAPKGVLVDHRNNGGLDNRRDNLRLANKSQNNTNKPKRANTSSRYIGVSYIKSRKCWYAQIVHQGKHKWLGTFHDEIEAARAFDRAAIEYHGEFARLNFPE
jgi:hypothetical protein